MCNTCIGQKTFPIDKGRYQIASSYRITAITDATLTVYQEFWNPGHRNKPKGIG